MNKHSIYKKSGKSVTAKSKVKTLTWDLPSSAFTGNFSCAGLISYDYYVPKPCRCLDFISFSCLKNKSGLQFSRTEIEPRA